MQTHKTKYIFITGGVVSGIGKGITAASLGALLKARGLKVFVQKLDPYLNVSPGLMSPLQHGEVYVTADGAETDLDLGHYERFIDEELNRHSTLTMGIVYSQIIDQQHKNMFGGGTVQVVPHVTNHVKQAIYDASKSVKPDVHIVEIGGSVGDIESRTYIEALRQLQLEVGHKNCLFVHTTLLPYLACTNELKTKPTQHSVNVLMGFGIHPNFLVLRAEREIGDDIKEKISRMCIIDQKNIVALPDVDSIYKVPLIIHEQKMDTIICNYFNFKKAPNLTPWLKVVKSMNNLNKTARIALVGKYIQLEDCYLSVKESLKHAGWSLGIKVEIDFISAEEINEKTVAGKLGKADAIIVPGGFGERGTEGMITAINYARKNNIAFFGICMGMQLAIVEFARNVARLKGANSKEFNEKTAYKVIDFADKEFNKVKPGEMRLGAYDCEIAAGTLAHKIYGKQNVDERHRHRYEFNNQYKEQLQHAGLTFSGINKASNRVEIIELQNHPYFIACHYHPEFKSRPTRPHPLFVSFVKAAASKGK